VAKETQVGGTIRLPDGRSIPILVSLDLASLDRIDAQSSDDLLIRAVEVFGKAEKAVSWLNTANPNFSNRSPREVAQTAEGREQIEGVLLDLEYGFPA